MCSGEPDVPRHNAENRDLARDCADRERLVPLAYAWENGAVRVGNWGAYALPTPVRMFHGDSELNSSTPF